MSQSYGIATPNKVDVVSNKDGRCFLYLIQSGMINDSDILLLQEKLNGYLSYILDGQLKEEYPELCELEKVVLVVLENPIEERISVEFFKRVQETFEAEGVEFNVKVSQKD